MPGISGKAESNIMCKCTQAGICQHSRHQLIAFMISADKSVAVSSDLCTIGSVGGRHQGIDIYLQAGTGQLCRAGCDVFANGMAKAQGKKACTTSN